ncbi:MAG TPA: flagellar hook-associated protein FlgL [Candidatus Avamphibacillus intestinigallinarum]|nr:flagellar hook-associated protein FlgL [Candidatus Avamphibacillus intestinigallinarum]
MRVTQGMISNSMLNNLSKSYGKLDKYLDQLSTGRKINRPSDNPFIAIKGMSYRTEVKQIEQFKRNTNEVHNWMDNSDDALSNATSALQRIRELASQAANDTYDAEQRENISKEVEQLKEDLIDIANTNVNGKYIFNGTNTNEAPITKDEAGNYEFDFRDSDVNIEIAKGTSLKANVEGSDVFGEDLLGEDGVLNKLITALKDNDRDAIDASIGEIDSSIDDVVNTRADLGARMNRLDLIENRLSHQEITAKDTMSKNENVDYEEAITNLITQETLHRAALSAGTRIMQPTLLDFLR